MTPDIVKQFYPIQEFTLSVPDLFYIIPDTSWLLDPFWSFPLPFLYMDSITETILEKRDWPWPFGKDPAMREIHTVFRYSFNKFTWILAKEVLDEITSLHKSPTRKGTGSAKELIARMLESERILRVDASSAPVIELTEGALGIDSPTDHSILNLAIQYSKKRPENYSMILTRDSGIILEATSQRIQNDQRIGANCWGTKREEISPALAQFLKKNYSTMPGPFYRVCDEVGYKMCELRDPL